MPGLGDARGRSPANDSLRERCVALFSSRDGQTRQGPLVTHELVNGLLLLMGVRLLLTGVFVYLVSSNPLLVVLFHLVLSIPRLVRRFSADDGRIANWRDELTDRLPVLQSSESERTARSSRSSRSSPMSRTSRSRSSRSSRSRSTKERL
ncbi:hypothetical protein [Halogranum rubrum]|uniref:Uncharacterized protein n=1 Tax=Halogranum salarium B-1 TaxID=1210908 RepID=J3EUN9_9EURY|nr:hypothetical protein [Halogranum salarium]EJN58137.1 hypothetical protein HSB1_35540 [Halogranum salarium B-1]